MLPSPLNILTNVRNFLDVAAWNLAACRFPKGSRARCSVEVRERWLENRGKEEICWGWGGARYEGREGWDRWIKGRKDRGREGGKLR